MLRVSEKLLLIKLKITSISGNTYSYFFILAATLAAFYNYFFIILVIFLLIKFRNDIKLRYLFAIFFLILISFGVSKLKMITKTKNSFNAVVVEVDEKHYIVRKGFKKYLIITSEKYSIGDRLIISGTFQKYDSTRTPFGFDENKYYLSNNIYGKYKNPNIHKNGYNYLYFLKSKITNYFDIYPNNVKVYLNSLIFGKNSFEKDFKKSLNNLQISYLLSLSGVFIYAILKILNKVYFYFDLKLSTQHKLNILFLFGWLLLTGFKFVIVRILIIYILKSLNRKLNLKLTRLDILFLSFISIIVYNYNFVYSVGFSLSFIILTTLSLLEGVLKVKNSIIKQYINYFLIYIVSLPIFISMNNNIYLIVFLVTPLLVYIVRKVYVYVFLLLLAFPYFSSIIEVQINFLEKIIKFLSNLNISLVFPTFNNFLVFGYYIIFLFIFIGFSKKHYKRFFLLVILLIITYFKASFNPGHRLYFLDVGQGDTTIYISPFNEEVIVIDAFGDVGGVLKRLGIRKIDYLILTHPDYDHIKEANNLIKDFKVLNVLTNPYDNYNLNTDKVSKIYDGYYVESKNFNITFWGPLRNYYNNNKNSLIFTLRYLDKNVLFLGDASKNVEREVINKYQGLIKADILKIAHHGSNTSTSNELLQTAKPNYIIISCGYENIYGFPHKDVLNKIEGNYLVYRTDLNYTIYYYQIANYFEKIKLKNRNG